MKSHWPLIELLGTEFFVIALCVWQLISLRRDKATKPGGKK